MRMMGMVIVRAHISIPIVFAECLTLAIITHNYYISSPPHDDIQLLLTFPLFLFFSLMIMKMKKMIEKGWSLQVPGDAMKPNTETHRDSPATATSELFQLFSRIQYCNIGSKVFQENTSPLKTFFVYCFGRAQKNFLVLKGLSLCCSEDNGKHSGRGTKIRGGRD